MEEFRNSIGGDLGIRNAPVPLLNKVKKQYLNDKEKTETSQQRRKLKNRYVILERLNS